MHIEKGTWKRTIFVQNLSSKEKKNENIKYSNLTELFNVKNVPQMKNEDIWFADSIWYIWNICLSEQNSSKTWKCT